MNKYGMNREEEIKEEIRWAEAKINYYTNKIYKRKLKLEKNIGLVVIDYLQLVQGSGKKNSSREQEISEISRSLKILAKELEIPVIALSQLSRSAEKRDDKRPMLSDLRETGSLEQDADMIIFLYREDYYKKEEEKQDREDIEINIAKHRNGALANIKVKWIGNITRFVNLEKDANTK